MELRVYKREALTGLSKAELQKKLEAVQTNPDLSQKEIDLNVDIIAELINNGRKTICEKAMDQIKAGRADISDMNGH